MRYKNTITGFWAIVFFFFSGNIIYAQGIKSTVGESSIAPFKTGSYNFNSFTLQYITPTREWVLHNKESVNHPDAGFITSDNPTNAIEILSKRSYDSRYFIDKDTASKFYMVRSNTAINYLKDGQWLTIDKRLSAKEKKIYEASHQPEPIGFDLANKISYIKTFSGPVYFNNWELIGENGDKQTVLAIADWSHLSAGDDGIKITDVFPGIDAEMIVDKGSIKTNFIVKQNLFKGYAQLVLTDEFRSDLPGVLTFSNEEGGGVDYKVNDKPLLHIDKAIMYAESKAETNIESINYDLSANRLSMLINETDLNNKLLLGNVLIDPQVSSNDSIPLASIGGSMNFGNSNLTCNYNLVMTTPAKATLVDIAFQFGFEAKFPASVGEGQIILINGACRTGSLGVDSSATGFFDPGYGTTKGIWASEPQLLNCMPPPACTPQSVTIALAFYNTTPFGPNGVCSNQYVSPHEPSPPAAICQGNNATLTALGIAGVPPYNYTWDHGAGNGNSVQVSPASTTKYTVTITDQCGNTAKANSTITVIPTVTPSVTITVSANPICPGTSVTFSAIPVNGGANPSYQWILNGNNVGGNSSTYTDNALANNDSICCVLTSSVNCTAMATATSDTIMMVVPIEQTPTVSIVASANHICGEVPITFSAVPIGAGPSPSYQWQVNGINIGSNDSLYTSNSLADGDLVSCIISVSNTGCYTSPTATSNQLVMDIKPIPGIVLTASRLVLPKGDTTQLNAIITGGYTSFAWTPTTGLSDPLITNPIAIPLTSTVYLINVTDTDGCIKGDSILIGVYDPIFIPNAFTPNGDGENDVFRVPQTISFDLTDFVVYNRWGIKVFETSDINQGWDGTYQGNKCDIGTYVYIITGSNAKGKVFIKGYVSLFR
jgi:gliding motility-associated-like protein